MASILLEAADQDEGEPAGDHGPVAAGRQPSSHEGVAIQLPCKGRDKQDRLLVPELPVLAAPHGRDSEREPDEAVDLVLGQEP
jgi:hypothetical protein